MDKTEQFWNKQAEKYDNSERRFDPVFKKILELSKQHLQPSDKVLDFGCATGTKTIQLSDSVKHIHGLDLSYEMIEGAHKKAEKFEKQNISFSQGTIFKNDFKNESFDVIISYGVLHLLKDIDNVLMKINELLKPGGLFISSSACMKDKMELKNRLEFSVYYILKAFGLFPLHLNLYKCEDVESIISENSFNIIEKERIFNKISISYIVAQKK